MIPVQLSPRFLLSVVTLFAALLNSSCGDSQGPPASSRVTVSPLSVTLDALSDTARFSAAVFDKKDRPLPEAVVVWSVSDPSVATIDQTGKVTSLANGSVSVLASSDAAAGTALLTVSQEAADVQVSAATDSLTALLQTSQFNASAFDALSNPIQAAVFSWDSSDETVATVDAQGLATAVAVGSTEISATVDGVTSSATLVVTRTASTEVGPDGGTLQDVDGLVSLEIPAGALAQSTTLQIELGAVPNPAGIGALGETVTLLPEGQQFALPVTLTIPVDVGIDPNVPIGVYQYSSDDDLLLHYETVMDLGENTVSVELNHFSTYLAAPVLLGLEAGYPVGFRLRNCPTSLGAGDCDSVWEDVQRAFEMWGFFSQDMGLTFTPTAGGDADMEVFFGQDLGIPIGERVGALEIHAQAGYDLDSQRRVIVLDDQTAWWPTEYTDWDHGHPNVERAVGHQIGHHLGLDHSTANDVMAAGHAWEPIPLSCNDLANLASEYDRAGFTTSCAISLQATSATSGLFALSGEAVNPAPTVMAVDATGKGVGGVTVIFDPKDGSVIGTEGSSRHAAATDGAGVASETDWRDSAITGSTFRLAAQARLLGGPTFSAIVGLPVGDIQVGVTTTGDGPDPDGYTVTIGEDARSLAINGQELFEDLAPGNHTVTLSGLAANCSVVGDNPVLATVVAAQTAAVAFQVVCPSNIGDLQVETTTTGAVPDPDGYTVTVGLDARSIGVGDQLIFEDLEPGDFTVTLSGLAPNCAVVGDNPLLATVAEGATTEVAFEVDCPDSPAPGGLLAFWPLDGDGTDESENGFHGTVQGAVPTMDRFGVEGSALQFDGLNDFVDIGQPVVPSEATSFSISAWIKSTGQQLSFAVPFSQGHRSFQGFAMEYGWPHSFGLSFVAGGEGAWDEAQFHLDLESQFGWHHYVVTYGEGVIKTYVDGAIEDTQSKTIDVGAYDFSIGRDTESIFPSKRSFNGYIDEVRVYEGTLIQEEIDYLYSGDGNLLHVEMKTNGASQDPDGYLVSVEGVGSSTMGVNTSLVFTGAPTGLNSVLVADVSPNCDVAGLNPRSVLVPEGGTARVTLSVNCSPVQEPEGLIFYSKAGDIYKMDVATLTETQILGTAASEVSPILSPDGTQIAFGSDANSTRHQLWIMDADGSNATEYATSLDLSVPTDWSGTQIILAVNEPWGTAAQVAWVDTGSLGSPNQVHYLPNNDTEPARGWFAPTTIATARTAQDPNPGGAVILIPTGGGAAFTAWNDATVYGTRGFSLSHAGTTAVFEYATSAGGSPDLYLMDMSDYSITPLVTNGSLGVWAPDDQLVIFHRGDDLWVTDLNGAAQPITTDDADQQVRSWTTGAPPPESPD